MGYTVFPCVETDDMDQEEASRRHRLCSRAHRHLKLAHEKLLKLHSTGQDLPPSKQLEFLKAHPELTSLQAEQKGVRPVDWRWSLAHDDVSQKAGFQSLNMLAE